MAEQQAAMARMSNALKCVQEYLAGNATEQQMVRTLESAMADFKTADDWLADRDRRLAMRCIEIAQEREERCSRDYASAACRLVAKAIRKEFGIDEPEVRHG